MGLPKFTYLAPRNLKEASALLTEHGEKARLMAGGTDLLIRMSHRAMTPEFVIGLTNLPALNYLHYDSGKGLYIGALAKLASAAEHLDVKKHYPAISHAASVTATVQIRHMGTIVGNICNAAPSADNATPLLVHDAEIVIVHPGGERTLPIDEFFRGPGLTALEKGEIVKEIRVPHPGPRIGSNYQKISARSKVDIAAVGVSALIQLDEAGQMVKARLALGAVAPVPLRARGAEKLLTGQTLTADLLEQVGTTAADESRPITDLRATAAYRRLMVKTLTMRAITASVELARQKTAGCEL